MGSAICAANLSGNRNHVVRILHWLTALLGRSWRRHPPQQLRLRETLALGERRFIAVIEFERQKFLIAGTGSSVAMLTALPSLENAKENPGSEAGHEDVPTWGFSSQGLSRQLIRK